MYDLVLTETEDEEVAQTVAEKYARALLRNSTAPKE